MMSALGRKSGNGKTDGSCEYGDDDEMAANDRTQRTYNDMSHTYTHIYILIYTVRCVFMSI